MKRKICFFSGSRSEYSLLKNLFLKFKNSKKFKTKLIVSGSHMSSKFGKTISNINRDGIIPDYKIKINENFNTTKDISTSISKLLIRSQSILKNFNPELVILLGDRYETYAIAMSCLILNIPIAHLHGGEVTYGSFDDNIRHSITKLSHLHFVANKKFKKRVIQLGEEPKSIFVVGGLGVDNIKQTKLLSKKEILNKFNLKNRFFLITFHPSTLENNKSFIEFRNLLKVLTKYNEFTKVITYPSSDIGNDSFIKLIKKFKKNNENTLVVKSLGNTNYLSFLKYSDLIIGNSSSGIAEAPTFKTPTINIGDRQRGRIFSKSVIHTDGNIKNINSSIKKGLSKKFKINIKKSKNPYGNEGASNKIFKIINKSKFNKSTVKKYFYDLK